MRVNRKDLANYYRNNSPLVSNQAEVVKTEPKKKNEINANLFGIKISIDVDEVRENIRRAKDGE